MQATSEPPLETFLDEARTVIEGYLARASGPRSESGGRGLAVFHETSGPAEAAEVALARDWQREKFRRRLAWVTGPADLGGRGLPDRFERALRRLEEGYPLPDTSALRIGLGTVAPTVLAHGTREQRAQHLAPIHSGGTIACQLFSEPEAGSDLAAVRTIARLDGAVWRVNGQKVWTSNAHFADLGLLLARTGEQAARHRGLTVFLVPMDSPGIEVRPLRQMTGGASFNEVFLDDVQIPDAQRLGEVGDGWTVARTALSSERGTTGVRYQRVLVHALQALGTDLRANGLADDPLARQSFAQAHILTAVADLTNREIIRALDDPGRPGPPPGLARLLLSAALAGLAEAAMTVAGPHAVARSARPEQFEWSGFVLGTPGMRLGGGTDEIVRNMIAESVLGLPREPRQPVPEPSSATKGSQP